MRIVTTTEEAAWVAVEGSSARVDNDLAPGDEITSHFKGFGTCFNELGWIALQKTSEAERAEVLRLLFAPDEMAFTYCRLPIGANDYSASWYSHNETERDFAMESFSIARDREAVIPYIRAAQAASGQPLTLFASPWSPPSWMKFPKAYNYGHIVWEDAYLKAYADYFVRFVKAYEAEGLPISAVHPQNEPDSDQKFPSCRWTGEQLRDFLRDYLAPAFRHAGLNTDLWLGTIERGDVRGDFNKFVLPTLADPQARAAIKGIGFQWAGKHSIRQAQISAPELDLIQTENECGDGENSWDYAHYVFNLVRHFLDHGVSAYVYWNAVLEEGGVSTWGWKQNSMFTVAGDGTLTIKPEFHVMRHFAGFVRPGATVSRPLGRWAGNAIYFRNPDGLEVVVMNNPTPDAVQVTARCGSATITLDLPPHSFTTIAE
ncbi:glycoside hydrolase family 30 protein [Rhizobium leguminosarum]|uniref:glycoside hydrolase family 30 protein n=1 Tax=Rhizobium leguminosarum TaxID=384 RepID=UPI0010314F28|nr:glycoside hydrolase family 30 beta sandwich domain-containing protein [Rhizobium leguminosarum]TAU85096.1 glycosyl hydrolase [Rhizobium leguminosarum]TAX11243.1 glycosyl hydrolase [Rhizobium leguminosarum]TAY14187.1 glycosyl hydrolase [Rhizobium leguminosarum]TAZ15911.1 glycosyl hydrolase [Rhizobium leguminosarum]